ncbi:hypothetical protein JCM10908_000083 [Rhodotorula pacifica]|uniref:zinc finger MYND domain-containing protein n=1 Tax=Rhodotorula pacifica TaxID=1495444 RepID=UPI0031757109
MSAQETSTCFVCGKATSQRCSKCWAAGLTVTFCSKEHQKLVWDTHKLVCGPEKASPFTPPELTKMELFVLGTIAHHPRVVPGSSAVATRMRAAREAMDGEPNASLAMSLERQFGLPKGSFDQARPAACTPVSQKFNQVITGAFERTKDRRYHLALVRADLFATLELLRMDVLYFSLSDFAYAAHVRSWLSAWSATAPPTLLEQASHRAAILYALVRIKVGKNAKVAADKVSTEEILEAYHAMIRPLLPFTVVAMKDRAQGFLENTFKPLRFLQHFEHAVVEIDMHPPNGTIDNYNIVY